MTGSSTLLIVLIALAAPVGFAAFWLLVTAMIGSLAGWYKMQRRYPPPQEPALAVLRYQSGWMGPARLRNVLTLSAHRSGISVGIARLLGPFQKPFLVPWEEIAAEPLSSFVVSWTQLRLGKPTVTTLTIKTAAWRDLLEAAGR